MDYLEAVKNLEEYGRRGIRLDLAPMRELMRRLCNAQDKIKTVHIAGTNGKGSVAGFICAIAKSAKIKTGCYRSPSLTDFCGGVELNGVPISESEAANALSRVFLAAEEMATEGFPAVTRFEAETAAAFLYFTDCGCDLAVIEAGMGGRDDATNVISSPALSVITGVSIDHVNALSGTLKGIAQIKSGIIKPNVPVVTAAQSEEVEQILQAACKNNNSALTVADVKGIKNIRANKRGQSFFYTGLSAGRAKLKISQTAVYQRENAIIAVESAKILLQSGFSITQKHIKQGLKSFSLFGRFSVLKGRPTVIIDGAHNENAAKKLAESLEQAYPNKRFVFLVGIFADKDYESILRLTAHLAKAVITLDMPQNKRLLRSSALAQSAKKYCDTVIESVGVDSAVELAKKQAGKNGIIVAFGSLSTITAVKNALKN